VAPAIRPRVAFVAESGLEGTIPIAVSEIMDQDGANHSYLTDGSV